MDLIQNSIRTANRNLVMTVPFLLQGLLAMLVGVAAACIVLFAEVDLDRELEGGVLGAFLLILIVGFGLFIAVQALVLGGISGMAKEAVSEGGVKFTHFIQYGKRYFGKALAIQLLALLLSAVMMAPFVCYVVLKADALAASDLPPLSFFAVYIPCIIAASAVYFLANFSMIPVVKSGISVTQSFKTSFRLLFKGMKDCLLFVACTVLFLVATSVVSIIPLLGGLVVMVGQLYVMVVFYLWSVHFYDKHKPNSL